MSTLAWIIVLGVAMGAIAMVGSVSPGSSALPPMVPPSPPRSGNGATTIQTNCATSCIADWPRRSRRRLAGPEPGRHRPAGNNRRDLGLCRQVAIDRTIKVETGSCPARLASQVPVMTDTTLRLGR